MAVINNKNEKEANRLLIKSIEDDLDYLLTEEFYNGRRTPCYAVKFLRDSIRNNPTIESCLVRGNYMTLATRGDVNESHRVNSPSVKTSWPRTDRTFLTNSAHRYLSETEITTDCMVSNLGRPTRATLLRDRMNGGLSRLASRSATVSRPSSCTVCHCSPGDKTLSSGNRCKEEQHADMGHGFLVGARYNAAHFLDLDSIKTKGLYVSKSNNGIVFTTGDPGPEIEVASPPNSPQSVTEESASSRDCVTHENLDTQIPRVVKVHDTAKIRTRMIPRPHSSVVTSKPLFQRGLPVVIGSRWPPADSTSSTYPHRCGPRASWSRSAINIHFSKQNRARQSRYRNGSNPSRSSPDPTVYNKGCIQCTKCSQIVD